MPPSRGLRILLVDDYGDVGAMLSEVLQARGYDTRTAYDGPAAIEIAKRFKPDIALLDIGLPGMSGYELARRLKALPGLERIRLVALTGFGQDADDETSRAAGFSYHLVKPIDFDLLEKILNEAGEASGDPAGDYPR